MPSAFERRVQPPRENFIPTETEGDDASTHGEDVGVIVLARKARRVEVLQSAARIPATLFAAICSPCPEPPSTMPRSAATRGHCAADGEADRRIVDWRLAVGAVIVDVVAEPRERVFQDAAWGKAGVVGANRKLAQRTIVLCGARL